MRFKFQTVIQRFNTFQQYWQRTVREIETGTYKRDVLRAAKRFGAKDALTMLGKKKAAQYAVLAEAQEKDQALRRQRASAIDEDQIEALEDYDAELEDFDDDAPTPPSRRVELPMGAGAPVSAERSRAAAAYAARMELDFGPTPGVESDYDALDADTGRVSALPATGLSRPSPSVTESSPTPGSPRAPQPLRGWPLPPAAGSAPGRPGSPPMPRPSRPDLALGPMDPDAVRRRLAELAAQGRRPQGGPPSEASSGRLDLELGAPGARRAGPPFPLSAPTPYSPSMRGPGPGQPPPSGPVQPPGSFARLPAPTSPPPPLSPRPQASSPMTAQPRLPPPPDSAPSVPRPLVTQAARPVQAFAGLANRPLSGARPLPPPSVDGRVAPPPPSVPDPAQQARAAAANVAAAAREASAARSSARDDGSLDEQRMRQVYTRYMDAKRSTNESTAGVTFERLAQSLRAQEAKLKASHSGKRVDFEVVVKDGKATLKPIVR